MKITFTSLLSIKLINSKMKKFLILTLLVFTLTSCQKETKTVEKQEKKDFIVQTKNFWDFDKKAILKKSWKLISQQAIKISSNATWRVKTIFVKEWEKVKAWQIIAKLQDNILHYWLNIEKTENAIKKTEIAYKTTKIALDKKINDMKINLENLKIDAKSSKSSLELEKIENSLKKLILDWENLKISNKQTIDWFYRSVEKDRYIFINFLNDIIDFSDKQLWVTKKNFDKDDAFENYLWIKNTTQKFNTKTLLRELIVLTNNNKITIDELLKLKEYAEKISDWYKKIDSFLSDLEITFDNSVYNAWSLSVSDISTKKWIINWYQTSLNTYNSSFVAVKNNIYAFLDTYLNNEESLKKQIELLGSDKKIFIKWLDTSIEIQESTLEEAILNRELSLENIKTTIVDAEIAHKQALKEYNKLTIKSPISWIVWEIFIDLWQEISNWMPMFDISNNSLSEAKISFNKKELSFVSENNSVFLNFDWNIFTWSIYSISKNADSNLKYVSRVIFQDDPDLIGNIISVFIPIEVKYNLISLDILKIKNNWVWTINSLKNWKIEKLEVKLGDIYEDSVEIITNLDKNTDIILNNIDNYNENKFNLKLEIID